VAPVPVETIDTSGAGDAFCGALGHYLAADDDLAAAVLRANQVAAWSTTLRGAQIPEDKSSDALRAGA
jgi:ribokinase